MTMDYSTAQILTLVIVAAPFFGFAVPALLWMAGWEPDEKPIARMSSLVYSVAVSAAVALFAIMRSTGTYSVTVPLGSWFRVGDYEFSLILLADRLSVPLIGMTVLLSGLVGSFSVRYLHRDPGYFRFFLLLHLFAFGALVAFAAGSFDLLIGGWELVGLTSVLLIGFFHGRPQPVSNGLRVFAVYRFADIGLLAGVFALHHFAGTASCSALFRGQWPSQGTLLPAGAATVVAALLLFAAMGKSAQFPFSGWLPRAMEGPTPSSAIFYGAISVHLGCYLLLRIEPILQATPVVQGLTVAVGLITAVCASMAGRAATDAKTSLAYASMTQVGIIFAECGMGWHWLALMHMSGHAALRTLQFLRAPSMLHDYHRVHAAAGGQLPDTGTHYEAILPAGVRAWLYRFALDGAHLDTLIDRFIVRPVMRLARGLTEFEAADARPREQEPVGELRRKVAGGLDA